MNQFRRRLICGAAAALGAPWPAFAQQASDTPQRIERSEITGSNIKRVDAEGPAPVAMIKREHLERSGGQNLQEVLQNLTISNTGSFNEGTGGGNTFAPGTAGISLRGLGANTTLVLLNGRRLANYGFAQGINVAFVDLNSIPTSAIERIEILKDGASAIYGSDALAGVVNIILRKDFEGAEIRAGFGQSGQGDAGETRGSLTLGSGNVARSRFSIIGTLDYYKRDPLYGADRSFSATADGRGRGGLDLRSPSGYPSTWLTAGRGGFTTNTNFPNCPPESVNQALNPLGTCAYNFAPDVMTLAKTERKGVFGRAVLELSASVSAFAEFGWNENESFRQLAPTPDAFTLPVGHNSNPYSFAVPITYRFLDVGPRITRIESETSRHLLGLRGSLRTWDWEAAYVRGRNEIVDTGSNFVLVPVRNTLVAGGLYNFVDPSRNDPSIAESLRVSPVRKGDSDLESWDAKLSGTIIDMPGGPLALAAGAERREESVKDVPDPLGAQGLVIGSGGTSADGSRSMNAAFAEVSVPFAKNIEGQIAVRHERYSDYGSSTVPKYAISIRPASNLLLRAGYNKGFRAPSLAELYLGQTVAFPGAIDTPRCSAYRAAFGTADPRSAAVCAPLQRRTVFGGNPNLAAEQSESETLGLVWDATPSLSVALDYYRFSHRRRITTPTLAAILENEDLYPGAVVRNAPEPDDIAAGTRGLIAGLNVYYYNATSQATRGYDLEVRHRVDFGGWGRMDLISSNTYVEYLRRTVSASAAPTEFAGTPGIPRYRGAHSAVWKRGSWDASLVINVIGNYKHRIPATGFAFKIDSWITGDVQATYSAFKNLRLTGGVRNVLDRDPPFASNDSAGFDTTLAHPVGRFFYGRISYTIR